VVRLQICHRVDDPMLLRFVSSVRGRRS
jgi:hypothetical protein